MMQQQIERLMASLRAEMKDLRRAHEKTQLPLAMTFQRAAAELRMTVPEVRDLVKRRELATCVVAGRKRVSRSSLLRLR